MSLPRRALKSVPKKWKWLLALLALAAAWRALAPALWLSDRVAADQAALQMKRPALTIGARERVLVVSPHLDDETLGAGGLLAHLAARGAAVRVVFLTNGDGSGSTILALNFGHGRRFSFVETARVRQREALAALEKLGVPAKEVAFLGYPDGDLQTLWDGWNSPVRSRFTRLDRVPYANAPGFNSEFRGANLLRDLRAQIAAFGPTRVLSTHGADTHPDHWSADAFARLALQVLEEPGAPRIEHDGFVIHHGIFPIPHGHRPSERLGVPSAVLEGGSWRDFELSPREQAAKGAALEEYASQLVFTPHYLRAFVRRNEPLGRAPGGLSSASWRDESEESWALARRPGADVRAVRASASSQGLRVQVDLAAPQRAGVTCVLGIKSVLANGRVVARRFEARGGGQKLPFFVRWSALGGAKPRAVVLDASTWSGAPTDGAMLDRTPSRAVRLE